MPDPVPSADLPPSLLRALGELYVAVIRLDAALGSGSGLGREPAAVRWRRRALAASEEARRVAAAFAGSPVVADTVLVASTDGSTVAMSTANVLRLATSIRELTRRGTLLGDPDEQTA